MPRCDLLWLAALPPLALENEHRDAMTRLVCWGELDGLIEPGGEKIKRTDCKTAVGA